MVKETGGKAFPLVSPDGIGVNEGMELRDYFAAKAMQAEIIVSCSDATPLAYDALARACVKHDQTPAQRIAQHAYEFADAMLVERQK